MKEDVAIKTRNTKSAGLPARQAHPGDAHPGAPSMGPRLGMAGTSKPHTPLSAQFHCSGCIVLPRRAQTPEGHGAPAAGREGRGGLQSPPGLSSSTSHASSLPTQEQRHASFFVRTDMAMGHRPCGAYGVSLALHRLLAPKASDFLSCWLGLTATVHMEAVTR